MTTRNEAAERLRSAFLNGPGGFGYAGITATEFEKGLDEALAAERRATVERIRERIDAMPWVEHVSGLAYTAVVTESNRRSIRAILDEEAAR